MMKTSTVRIKVERRSGFFSSLGEPTSLQHLYRFKNDAGLTGLKTNQFLTPLMIETQGRTTDFLRKKADDLLRFFRKYDVRVLDTQKKPIKIGVNELHCPRVPEASGNLSVVKEHEESNEDSVQILGVGGGDEFTTSLSVGESLSAKGECVATVHSLEGIFEWCEMNTPDGEVRRFVRLKDIDDTSEVTEGIVLTQDTDECQFPNFHTRPATRDPINLLKYGSAELTKTLEIARGSKWTNEAKIDFDKFGINLGAKYVAQKTSKTILEYKLVSGHEYLALKPIDRPFWLWQVKS